MNEFGVVYQRTGAAVEPRLQGQHTQAGEMLVAWNGRIDNRDELADLLRLPIREREAISDPTLLAAVYAQQGEEGLARVVGDYVSAVWDRRTRALFCARDPLGQRPFFYHVSPALFVAGSSVAAVLAHPAVPRRPNDGMVAEYLACAITSLDETLWAGVRRLPPGTWLRIDATCERRGTIPWLNPGDEIRYSREAEYAEHLGDLLRTAVRARLRGVPRAGVELSGGVDSASVAAMARAELGERAPDALTLLSLVFPGLACDERPVIEACHAAWNLPAVIVAAGGRDAADATMDVHHQDFPYHPNGTMSVGLRRRARAAGVRVILTGIGGDEWFGGSRMQLADQIRQGSLAAAVRHARDVAHEAAEAGAASQLFWYGFWPHVPRGVKAIARGIRRDAGMALPWMAGDFVRRTSLAARVRALPDVPLFPTAAQTDIARSAVSGWSIHGTEMEARLAADLSIELRHPLADLRIARFGLAIPEAQRWRGRERKRVLRAAAAGLVPDAARLQRHKVDFSPVVVQALQAHGGAAFFRRLTVCEMGWVDGRPLDRMYHEMLSWYAARDSRYVAPAWTLWMIVGVERWARAAGFTSASRPLRIPATA